jgi:hypothetical protein
MDSSLIVWLITTAKMFLNISAVFLLTLGILYFIQHQYCQLAQRQFGRKIIWISAIIGTPIHEISHAILCTVFGHKINEIALFRPGEDGTLGFVMHSYNPRNLWHIIGNFFIGIAPVFGGTLALALITYFILPNGKELLTQLNNAPFIHLSDLSRSAIMSLCEQLFTTLKYSATQSTSLFILWFYLVASISLHLSPSTIDIKGGIFGFLLFIVIIFILTAVSQHFEYQLFNGQLAVYLGMVSMLLILAMISSLISGILILLIATLFGKRR